MEKKIEKNTEEIKIQGNRPSGLVKEYNTKSIKSIDYKRGRIIVQK